LPVAGVCSQWFAVCSYYGCFLTKMLFVYVRGIKQFAAVLC
jgi:hypothetical protein